MPKFQTIGKKWEVVGKRFQYQDYIPTGYNFKLYKIGIDVIDTLLLAK